MYRYVLTSDHTVLPAVNMFGYCRTLIGSHILVPLVGCSGNQKCSKSHVGSSWLRHSATRLLPAFGSCYSLSPQSMCLIVFHCLSLSVYHVVEWMLLELSHRSLTGNCRLMKTGCAWDQSWCQTSSLTHIWRQADYETMKVSDWSVVESFCTLTNFWPHLY